MESEDDELTAECRRRQSVSNFGGNVFFEPAYTYAPRTEEEVLQILNRHADSSIRVAGALHSWSDAAASNSVLIDTQHLDHVEIDEDDGGRVTATVGAGCTIQKLLGALREVGATLPTVGAVKKQTIAGAISTGTHGSGRPSLSHFMDEIRIAGYDPDSGKARIYRWSSGEELEAARCSLGCMGVILTVKFRCKPKYRVEEGVVERSGVEEIIADQDHFPLQQFVLLPYSWRFFSYQRRITGPKQGLTQGFLVRWTRLEKFLFVDFFLHLVLKLIIQLASAREGSSTLVQWFYRVAVPPFIARDRRVVDSSENTLTMRHDLFRHLEIEVFVPSYELPEAVEFIKPVVSYCAGQINQVPPEIARGLKEIGELENLKGFKRSYTHHYPIFFRHVLKDDAMISMTSGVNESYYSISFFTYLPPQSREYFYALARFMAVCLVRLFNARLHWGKFFPLTSSEIARQYPRLEEFREICRRVDPHGTFQNDYTHRVLGFAASDRK